MKGWFGTRYACACPAHGKKGGNTYIYYLVVFVFLPGG